MTRRSSWLFRIAVLLGCLGGSGCVGAGPSPVATGERIENSTNYPRVVRLLDASGTPNGGLLASSEARLFESHDSGATWRYVGSVAPGGHRRLRCCEALIALRRPVGALSAGTLLFAASYWVDGVAAIAVFASVDQGLRWTYLGAPVRRGGPAGHGLWEPEFEIARDGALVMLWSDETDPKHSQKLAQLRTYDGLRWQDERDTVASARFADRPGMATVSRSPAGRFLMTYEICGPVDSCAVFTRTSDDGWNFGDPSALGVRARTRDGDTLFSAPVNIWAPSRTDPDGRFVLVAKKVLQPDGTTSPLSGGTLFVNADPGDPGFWKLADAPVKVPDIALDACQNYSSALLAAPDGSTVLELAGDRAPGGGCVIHAARGRLDRTHD